MQKMEWHPFMQVDAADLDAGRRRILDHLNRLVDKSVLRDQAAVALVLVSLRAAAASAFALEERAMLDAGYRMVDWHKRQHGVLLEQIAAWERRVAQDWHLATGANLFLTLVPLVVRHFGEADRRFAQYRQGRDAVWKTAA